MYLNNAKIKSTYVLEEYDKFCCCVPISLYGCNEGFEY